MCILEEKLDETTPEKIQEFEFAVRWCHEKVDF